MEHSAAIMVLCFANFMLGSTFKIQSLYRKFQQLVLTLRVEAII